MNHTSVPHTPHSALLEAIPGIFYRAKRHHDNIQINNMTNVVALTGYQLAELEDSPNYLELVIHPADYDKVAEIYYKIQPLESETVEYRIITKYNEVKYVKDQLIAYRQPADETIIEGFISVIKEPTTRARLLHQLHAYRNAIDVNIISSITDVTSKIIYANKNFCNISKYTLSELIGQNHSIIRSGQHSREFFESMWKTISAGKHWHGEIMNRAKDGSHYWVDTVIIPIFDEKNAIENYLSLRMLITDKKETEMRYASYTQMLEQIAFMVAHRVRGPLCSILGLVNILENPDNTKEQIQKSLGYLKSSANELNELTQELSRFLFEHEIALRSRDFERKINDQST